MNADLKVLIAANLLVILLAIYFGIFVYPKKELSEETKRRTRSWVSNAYFREFWYFLMSPLKNKLIQWDVNPNTITWIGFWFSVVSAYFFATGEWGWAAWMVILSSTCDVYDGQLARARNISLKSGAFLDSALDRVGESAMFFGLSWFFRDNNLWFTVLFLTFSGSQLTSYARARAEGLSFTGTRGFFQRAERMITLSIGMGLTPILDFFVPGCGMYLVKATLTCLCLGSVQTGIARSIGIYQEIRQTEI